MTRKTEDGNNHIRKIDTDPLEICAKIRAHPHFQYKIRVYVSLLLFEKIETTIPRALK